MHGSILWMNGLCEKCLKASWAFRSLVTFINGFQGTGRSFSSLDHFKALSCFLHDRINPPYKKVMKKKSIPYYSVSIKLPLRHELCSLVFFFFILWQLMPDEMVRRSPQIKLCRQHEEDNGRAISGDLSFAVQAVILKFILIAKMLLIFSRCHHIKLALIRNIRCGRAAFPY